MGHRHTYLTFRNILFYVVLLWSGMTANAQSGKGNFAGRVVDKDTKQPVGYAAVRLLTLPDSAFVTGVATTDDGKFKMPVVWPKDKKLFLEISFIGYTTFSKPIPASFRGSSQNLGDIALLPDGFLLNETVIVGKAPLAVTEQDTTVFNASAYRTPEGSMLEDLVKQLPGGEIDGDGKLLIHGKEVKKILVDGKEFFTDDPKAALKNLPVEMVEKLKAYEGEVRTLRAWAYYNIFEIWGGALPLNIEPATVDGELPPTADPDFDTSCKKIYNFIATELDDCYEGMVENQVNRMNKAVNRMIKARLLLNAEVFIKESHYTECAELCREIISGKYGKYELAKDYRDIYSINNTECPEVIMAFACEDGKLNMGWMRMTFYPYNIWDYFGGTYSQSGWNCTCLVPSYDNAGTVNELGGTQGATCFLDAAYGDKLGAVYERFDDRDIRKKNYNYDKKNGYSGIFLKGTIKANYGKGEALKADADRDGQDLAYVDQVGTFMNLGRNLETVMSPRWGETNSGLRLVKYPVYPTSAAIDFQNIDEVEFRLSEVYYMLAECEMRAGQADKAKELVNEVRKRYFSAGDWADVKDKPGRGFTAFDMDWMLSQWGVEFLNEGRRRRTDLRRFDKFTQGQWWFFGRATDNGQLYPAKRDRKYEWYPLPASALLVNQGLIQNPNYK